MSKSIYGKFLLAILSAVLTLKASAYCVYNHSNLTIYAEDTRSSGFNKYWSNTMMLSGEKGCCPGDKKECKKAKIYVARSLLMPKGKTYPAAPYCNGGKALAVDNHGYIDITGNGDGITCKVYH